jgi:asparagine synthase (glutamine-hydrolysing)
LGKSGRINTKIEREQLMCGIAGVLGAAASENTIAQLLEKQRHRGPDAEQFWVESGIALGHNRLSIIDLSEEANQPMSSQNGRFIMVFNGEIYNYKELQKELTAFTFRTSSDSEVLLAAYQKWGTAMLSKLNGMFSIAIWDTVKQELFLARDRFGVKPLYYSFHEGSLYFASEIKSLFHAGIPKVMHTSVWAAYFLKGSYGMPDETFWQGIHQLRGGYYTTIASHKLEVEPVQWYDFVKNINETPRLTATALREQYEALLHDAIRLRFRADVPIGMNISGGLDSSILLAMVNAYLPSNQKIDAFTFYSNNQAYDELNWVEDLVANTGYDLNKVLFTPGAVPDLIQKISYYQDEPFGGFPTLAYSLLFEQARTKKIPVILDGQGMDEAWAGYDYYFSGNNSLIQGVTTSPVHPEIIHKSFLGQKIPENYGAPFDNALQNLQYRDLFYTKIPRALRFNDRISMMYGIELREPFLDYRLVELAFAQGVEMKYNGTDSKWMLREIVKDKFDNTIVFAPKKALQTPQREWIGKELQSEFHEYIHEFAKFDFVNCEQVLAIWEQYCKGNNDNSFYIWQWVNSLFLLQKSQ